jgi:hypothetical protein
VVERYNGLELHRTSCGEDEEWPRPPRRTGPDVDDVVELLDPEE